VKTLLLFLLLLFPSLAFGSSATQNFQLTVTHCVVLTWGESTTSGVIGYDVYRGGAPGQEAAMAYQLLGVGSGWLDVNVEAGQEYCYYLTAVSASANSAPSNESCATVPTP
jgi:hypothetical protein